MTDHDPDGGLTIEHPDFPATPGRWSVYVASDGVRGCTGSYRWLWVARLKAHSNRRYWPGPKFVEIRRDLGA